MSARLLDLLLAAAKEDDRIRAVLLSGSRANPAIPKDKYQDYDICLFVTDITPYYNNPGWVTARFGQPLIMQMPEAMRYPDGGGHFNYMMIYPDGLYPDCHRLDLTFDFRNYVHNGEPAITLLDKDNGSGFVPPLPPPDDALWHIKAPTPLFYSSCCNNFWWCLNNVAKGIARDELPYAMSMLNDIVRRELHDMMDWYIGITRGFALSTGKDGKYFARYLPPAVYERYRATYAGADYRGIWTAVFAMADLFHDLAVEVAGHFSFAYRQDEEDGMRAYLRMVRE